jgi:Family of unknown function (DUF6625)
MVMFNTQLKSNRQFAFVIAYYGRWPFYWDLWLESAAKNSKFHFLVLTDLPKPPHIPDNVRILPVQPSELSRRISEVVGFALPRITYHKLCDFKPFYGLAFPDLLQSYRYWGYCDIDLFFGNLQPLEEMAESEQYDFISPFEYTVGHCTLIRNKRHVNEIPLKIPDLRSRFFEPVITFMEEGAISEAAVHAGGFTFGVVNSLSDEWRKSNPFLGATARPDGTVAGMSGWFLLHYRDGRVLLYDDSLHSHEALYFHFMGMKQPRFWRNLKECSFKEFSFTSYGMVPGLLDPAIKQSLQFRMRCWAYQFPGYVYRAARNRIPDPVIRRIREARRRRASN